MRVVNLWKELNWYTQEDHSPRWRDRHEAVGEKQGVDSRLQRRGEAQRKDRCHHASLCVHASVTRRYFIEYWIELGYFACHMSLHRKSLLFFTERTISGEEQQAFSIYESDLNGEFHHPCDGLENLVDVGVEISQRQERVEPLFTIDELQTWLATVVRVRYVPRHLYIIIIIVIFRKQNNNLLSNEHTRKAAREACDSLTGRRLGKKL